MDNPRHEELIAYLDGELDPSESQKVEERLKHDPAYRQELVLYERSWDMLERLGQATVGETFTRSTMEMISLTAAKDAKSQPLLSRLGWRKLGGAAALLLAALVAGYAGGRAIWPDPNRQLLEDMSVLEDLSLYEQAGSIDFLRELNSQKLFSGDISTSKLPGLTVPESLAERRAEIERMSPAEREHWSRRSERFANLSEASKQQLRQLHDRLNHEADGLVLRGVLVHYHEWFGALTPEQRNELEDLEEAALLARIAAIKQEQAAQHEKERKAGPSDEDLKAILAWLNDFAWRHRKQLFSTLSDKRHKYLETLDDRYQRQAAIWMLMHRQGGQKKGDGLQLDYDQMVEKLSPEGQTKFNEAAQVLGDRPMVGRTWVRLAQWHRAQPVGVHGALPPLDDKKMIQELKRFRDEELTTAQRDAVFSISWQPRQFGELLALYLEPTDRLVELTPEQIKHNIPTRGQRRPSNGTPPAGRDGSKAGK